MKTTAVVALLCGALAACDSSPETSETKKAASGASNGAAVTTTTGELAADPPPADDSTTMPFRATGPIAKVNGEEVTAQTFNDEARRFGKMARYLDEARIERYRERIVTQLVRDVLTDQAIRKAKIAVPKDEVEKRFNAYIENNFHAEEDVRDYYRRSGMTEERIKSDLRKSIGLELLLEKKYATTVSDAEVRKYYDDNQRRFEAPEEVRASHILLRLERDATEEVVKERKKEARQILRDARKDGADFAALAKEHSEGPTAKKGGDLGWFSRKQMVPEFSNAAFKLEAGQVSEPVRSSHGLHIIKVFEKKPERIRPFEEVRDEIRLTLERAKKRDATIKMMADLREKAEIERIDANIVANPDFVSTPPKFGQMNIAPDLTAPRRHEAEQDESEE